MDRVWKDAHGFARYEVSSDGLVRNKNRRWDWAEFLTPHTDKYGYVRFVMYRGEPLKRTNVIAHRLFWETFRSPIPAGMQINHKNGVRNDNRLENLEICTPSENHRHAFRFLGRKPNIIPSAGSKNGRAKLREADIPVIRGMLRDGKSDKDLARLYNVSPASIWFIRTGQTWKNAGKTTA